MLGANLWVFVLFTGLLKTTIFLVAGTLVQNIVVEYIIYSWFHFHSASLIMPIGWFEVVTNMVVTKISPADRKKNFTQFFRLSSNYIKTKMASLGRVATVSLSRIPDQVGLSRTQACPPIGVSMVLDHGLRFCCRSMEDTVTMLKEIKESGLRWGYILTLDTPKHWFPGESILHIDEDADCFKLKFTVGTIVLDIDIVFPNSH